MSSSEADNPLLHPPALPHGAPPFTDIKPKHFRPAIQFALAAAKKDIEEIRKNQATPTFENTIEALEFAGPDLARISSIFNALSSVRSIKSLEKLRDDIKEKLIEYENDIFTDSALFDRIKTLYDSKDSMTLDSEQKMLLEKTYNKFIRGGALLNPAAKLELLQIEKEISTKMEVFLDNLRKSANECAYVVSDENDLAGLPERLKSIYRAAAERNGYKGKWLIEMSPPPDELLEYSDNRQLRRAVYKARYRQAYGGTYDNRPIIMDILCLRHRKAQLFGYKNYAEFEIADCMAKNAQTAIDLLQRTGDAYKAAAQNLYKKVVAYAGKTGRIKNLEPWDFDYYNRKLQEENFDVNIESMRNYFELNDILKGFFAHTEKLFGVEIKETKNKYPIYHRDAKVYEVTDKTTGKMLGIIYGDFYARANDKDGSWVYAVRERGLVNGQDACPLAIASFDLAKPGKNRPTLLAFEEIETVFHEFGHALHCILAKGHYPSQNGTNVTFDFLEVPSQMQECWARNVDVLMSFARHWKTGSLPNRTDLEKYIAHEKAHVVNFNAHGHFLAMLDMTLHTTDPATISSIEDLENKIAKEHWIFPRAAGGCAATHFDYLQDYAGKFYTYTFGAALVAAIYEEYQEKGIYDPDLNQQLRKLYESGAHVPPMDLFRSICKDPPNPDALLRRDGLLPPKNGSIQP